MEYIASSMWDGKTGGIATLKKGELVFDTPETYGGRGQGLCPYRLFIAGVLGCLNNTFLDVKRRSDLDFLDVKRRSDLDLVSFNLGGKINVKFDGEGYSLTDFQVSGEVVVAEGAIELGERCVEIAKTFCPLTRSMKDCIPFEYNIIVKEQ
jgi:uncharacterized OsmC-like protein